ncbi:MAG TPA: hypothetical protein VKS79_11240, partial [Gemmataceae bacterium]|nr:hypothetical protein [Gemmataceae bacterium]
MCRFFGLLAAGFLLVLPAWADDKKDPPPKDNPSAKEPATAREKYQAMLKDYNTQHGKLAAEINKAKGEERQKLAQKSTAMSKDFAEKFYKLAEDDPKSLVATDALFWVAQNGNGSPAFSKAMEKVADLAAEIPLPGLVNRLRQFRGGNAQLFEAVVNRADKDAKEPQAAELLVWVAERGSALPIGQEAANQVIERYPAHAAVTQL